jgi:hypothetical protein
VKETLERKLSFVSIVFSLFTAILWVADSYLNHRLTLLQSLELQAELQPRAITPAQQEILVAKLRNAMKGPVIVEGNWNDLEAERYGLQILSVLTNAGFERRATNAQVGALFEPGCFMFVRDVAHPPPHAMLIQQDFRESGISIDGKNASQVKPIEALFQGTNSDLVLIWISDKPRRSN